MVYYECEFASLVRSVDAFIELVLDVYAGRLTDEALELLNPYAIMASADGPEVSGYTFGPEQGHFRLYWTTCDGACKGALPSRN